MHSAGVVPRRNLIISIERRGKEQKRRMNGNLTNFGLMCSTFISSGCDEAA